MNDVTLPQRKKLRLPWASYQAGRYFITVCSNERKSIFGTIVNGHMAMNDLGRMVDETWQSIPVYFPGYATDEFIVMPNHIHCIICIPPAGAGLRAGPVHIIPTCPAPNRIAPSRIVNGPARRPAPALFDFVARFKSYTTHCYYDGIKKKRWHDGGETLWQRSYYDTLIRTKEALESIRAYIRNNPANSDPRRYGDPEAHQYGNADLLAMPKTAFVASRGTVPTGEAASLISEDNGKPIISSFISPMERTVLRRCFEIGRPVIQVMPCGFPERFEVGVEKAVAAGKYLAMSPFGPDVLVSASRAAWCNQYVLHTAETIVVGGITHGGMLMCLLADLDREKPVRYLQTSDE